MKKMKALASSEDRRNHYLSVPRQRMRIDGERNGRKKWGDSMSKSH